MNKIYHNLRLYKEFRSCFQNIDSYFYPMVPLITFKTKHYFWIRIEIFFNVITGMDLYMFPKFRSTLVSQKY